MFVKELNIRKRESYESNPGTFVGTVTLEGPTGKQEIVLSSAVVSKLFSLIAQDVCERATANARQVKVGMDEAIHAPLLLEQVATPIDEIPF